MSHHSTFVSTQGMAIRATSSILSHHYVHTPEVSYCFFSPILICSYTRRFIQFQWFQSFTYHCMKQQVCQIDFSLIPRPNKHKGGSGYKTKWTYALSVIMNLDVGNLVVIQVSFRFLLKWSLPFEHKYCCVIEEYRQKIWVQIQPVLSQLCYLGNLLPVLEVQWMDDEVGTGFLAVAYLQVIQQPQVRMYQATPRQGSRLCFSFLKQVVYKYTANGTPKINSLYV